MYVLGILIFKIDSFKKNIFKIDVSNIYIYDTYKDLLTSYKDQEKF